METDYTRFIKKIKTKDTILIVLAGSRLKPAFMPWADYDFFIVTGHTDKFRITREDKTIEAFYYSKTRLKNCLRKADMIPIDALATGKLIFFNNEKQAEKILKNVRKVHQNFKINNHLLDRLRYRFDMLQMKLESTDDSEDFIIRLLLGYYIEQVIQTLFIINNKVHPSISDTRQKLLELKRLPDNFNEKFNILLGIKPAHSREIKQALLESVEFIQKNIGHSKKVFSLKLKNDDITKII